MKLKNTASLFFAIAILTQIGSAGADLDTYEQMRAKLRQTYETVLPDGSVKISKQVRRWEWFWQGRLNEDGTLGTPQQYQSALDNLSRSKTNDDAQSTKVWKQLGPTAPDLPGISASWNGIGRINVIEISRQNDDLLYAGSAAGGLWRSTNGGAAWTYVPINGIPVTGISDIALSATSDQIIYVATGDANGSFGSSIAGFPSFSFGIVKSTDGGSTWQSTGFRMDLSSGASVARLWVDPRNSDILIAATTSGLQRSTDGGETWLLVASGAHRDIIGNPVNLNTIYAATGNPSGGAKISRSTDAGLTWSDVFTIPAADRIRLAVTKADANSIGVVASIAGNGGLEGVYRSVDGGASFAKLSGSLNLLHWNASGVGSGGQGFYDLAMEISPTNANSMFVGGVNIWRTSNGGSTWLLSAHWTGADMKPWVHADQHYFKFHPKLNRLYATHDGGIARSTDNGISWRDMSNGLRVAQYYGLSTSNVNTSLTLAGSQDNGTVISRNNGSTFSHTLDGDGMMSAIDYIDPQAMYGSQYNGQFYRSANQGGNWTFMSNANMRSENQAAWVSPIATDPTVQGTLYIGYSQIYKSTNFGSSFTRISTISTNVPSRVIAVAPSDSRYIYVAYNTALWFTTNGGTTWQQQSGLGGYIMDVEVHPTDPKKFWVAIGGFSNGQKLYEIANGVVTNISGVSLPNVPCNAVAFQRGTSPRVFIGTDMGVFAANEGSNIWEPFGQGMPATIVTDMRVLPASNILRVSTFGNGLWEIDIRQCVATRPLISTLGPSTVCQGDSVVLEASTGFATYRWTNGETTRRIVLKNVAETGSYSVAVEDNSGCRNASTETSVTILRSPSKPSISQRGVDTLRSSAIGGITKFQWFKNGQRINGATSRELFVNQTAVYSVLVTNNSDVCSAMSDDYAYTADPTSVSDANHSPRLLQINPNPSRDFVTVSIPPANTRMLEVFSISGQLMYSMALEDGSTEHRLSLVTYLPGVYLVRVSAGSSVWMAKLMRE